MILYTFMINVLYGFAIHKYQSKILITIHIVKYVVYYYNSE